MKNIIKKMIGLGIAFLMLFSFMGLAGCDGGINSGRIRGVNGGEFVTHFYSADFASSPILISDMQQFTEWIDEKGSLIPLSRCHYPKTKLSELLEEYTESFFEERQLVIFAPLISGTNGRFETRRVSYRNGELTIEVRVRNPRTDRLGINLWLGVMEITRISTDLTIEIIGCNSEEFIRN